MVSHAEIVDRPLRGPSSVTSRSTRSKHHHRGRSHHGGTSSHPQNEFPLFAQTGDAEIVISVDGQEKRYILHRLILAQCSGFFEAGTSDEWSRTPASRDLQTQGSMSEQALTRIGEENGTLSNMPAASSMVLTRGPPARRRWRYELDWDNTEDDEEPILVQKPPSSGNLFGLDSNPPLPPPPRTRPQPLRQGGFFRSMANLTPGTQSSANLASTIPPIDAVLSKPIIRDYDNLFRIFYNYAPTLDTTNIAAAYSECKALLNLADMYDALPVVGSRVDHHLLRFSSRLFKQIAKYPPSYLKLGYLARSRLIFAEALIHVVGQWPQALPYLKGPGSEVPNPVIELIEDKVDEVEEAKAKVEAKLFRLTLTTSRGERVNPTNDYLGWLAMSLFRQWLAENTTPPPAPILRNGSQTQGSRIPPGTGPIGVSGPRPGTSDSRHNPPRTALPPATVSTGRVYRLIGSTNSQAYLAHDELKRFLKLHPSDGSTLYSRDNLKRFERKVEEVKNIARDVVKPLTRNFLELDLRGDGGGGGLPYLTCCKVEEEDFPWD